MIRYPGHIGDPSKGFAAHCLICIFGQPLSASFDPDQHLVERVGIESEIASRRLRESGYRLRGDSQVRGRRPVTF